MKMMTCIVCPKGCKLQVEITDGMISVSGNECRQGEKHAIQELTEPKRNIATSVRVSGGMLPLASVKLSAPIHKDKIFRVMEIVKDISCKAPVLEGDIIIRDILGLGVDLVATKEIACKD